MTRRFYDRFIRPVNTDSDQAEREIVLNYLLVGVFALSVVTLLATFAEPLITQGSSHAGRLLNNFIAIVIIIAFYSAARYRQQYKAVAAILTLAISMLGCMVALEWGILDPYGSLLLGLSVVMAGILIGARYSLYMTLVLAVVLALIQHGESSGALHPNLSWVGSKGTPESVIGDVVVITAILSLIALVSWLFNRQMELSLRRARRSEKALKAQKRLLEVKVQQRTQQLEAARLEQMSELYRFAELGRLSTALFHDLANHLTNISLDIEGLKDREKTGIMQRLHSNVRHIDDVVRRVRQQLQGKGSIETFNVMEEINEIIDILSFDAGQAEVSVMLEPGNVRLSLSYRGDLTRFRQVLMNVILNAIEAYDRRSKRKERPVIIRLERVKTELRISVTDHGSVIPAARQARIFEPFYTTKPKGVGIGLFIVSQVVEKDFGGKISVSSDKEHGTTFSISLPTSYYGKSSRG